MQIQQYNTALDNTGQPVDINYILQTIAGKTGDSALLQQRIEKIRKWVIELAHLESKIDEYSDTEENSEWKRLVEKQKELIDTEKKHLSAVTWTGTFTKRKADKIKEYTQLLCIDIDKLPPQYLTKLYDNIINDEYTFAAFISPSGNGIKVLFKVAGTADQHKDYFLAIEKYFINTWQQSIDKSGKDICRLCFLSYDENLYHYPDSKVFTLPVAAPVEFSPTQKANLSKLSTAERNTLKATGQTVNDIFDSTQQYMDYADGNRNNFLFKFACNCNRVGIPEIDCQVFAGSFATDVKPEEIKSTIKSAYTHNINEHGKFKKQSATGTGRNKNDKINKNATRLTGSNAPFDKSQRDSNGNGEPDFVFWKEYKIKKGKGKDAYEVTRYELKRVDFCKFLFANGLHLYSTGDREGFQIVHSENGIIKPLTPQQCKHFALDWCKKHNLEEVEEMLRKGQKNYFAMNELDSLPYKEVNITIDNQNESYFYFKNCWVSVDKEGEVTTHEYDNGLNSFIWEANKIKHDFKKENIELYNKDAVLPHKEMNCEFARFVSLASWNPGNEEEKNFTPELITSRFESICSSIGFLLDGYKHPANRKGIFAIDHQVGDRDEQNGRTGKSIIPQACNLLKKVATINGKRFDPKYQFALEPITIDSQIVNFNDMNRNFDPETIFEVIADDYSVNCRNTGFIHFKYNSSPKVYVSSNHIPKGQGGSYTGRMHIIEFSDYFKPTYTPYDEFKHGLFGDWDSGELQRFFNFMLWCVALYKTQGLIDYPMPNYEKRKLISEVPAEFIDFMENKEYVKVNDRLQKVVMLNTFNEKIYFPQFRSYIKPHTFTKWVKMYCKQKNYKLNPDKNGGFDKSNGVEYFTIADKNYKPAQQSLI